MPAPFRHKLANRRAGRCCARAAWRAAPARSPRRLPQLGRRGVRRRRRLRPRGRRSWTGARSRRRRRPHASQRVIEAANRIVEKPYRYGGGHRPFGRGLDNGYDCSGSVSYALYGGRFLRSPLPSGALMNWGRCGAGPLDHRLRARRPRLRGGGRPALRHLHARSRRTRAAHRPALEQDPPQVGRLRGAPPRATTSPTSRLATVQRLSAPAHRAGVLRRHWPPRSRPAAADAAPAAVRLSPLHAEPDRKAGGRIVDSRGREVLLRGVNVNALAEYWKGSGFRTVFPLARKDPARMAAIGWNAVRLLVSWSRIEPAPGRYDRAYLGRVAATVAPARPPRHLHDRGPSPGRLGPRAGGAGGPGLRSAHPPGPGLGRRTRVGHPRRRRAALLSAGHPRAQPGRDGGLAGLLQPTQRDPGEWACRPATYGCSRLVARRFGRSTAVAGFDLMNEPNAIGDAQQAALSAFYGRALAPDSGRRAGRARAPPSRPLRAVGALVGCSARARPPDFKRDRDVVYAPHLYTGGFTNGPIGRGAFAVARREARDIRRRARALRRMGHGPAPGGQAGRSLLPAPPGASGLASG